MVSVVVCYLYSYSERIIHDTMQTERFKKQIFFRARRGLKETDMIFARFLKHGLDHYTQSQLEGIAALLELPDQTLLGWFVDGKPVDPAHLETFTLVKEAQ